jgi:hypothetical protein
MLGVIAPPTTPAPKHQFDFDTMKSGTIRTPFSIANQAT